MNTFRISAYSLALCVATLSIASAQTVPPADVAAIGPPPMQHSASGIAYLSGGAGDEERLAMEARRREFPLKLVLSAGTGEYIVADRVSLSGAKGRVMDAADAGPVVMIKAPPGSYTVEVVYQGRTQRRQVQVGKPATVGFRFPG